MAKKLPELSERSSSVDSDIFLVNSANLDYKQTKAELLASERARMDEIENDVATNGQNITNLTTRIQELEDISGSINYTFNNTSSLTAQVDSLANGVYFGTIPSYGHMSETGVPKEGHYYVKAMVYTSNYRAIEIWRINNVDSDHYMITNSGGTWGSWVHVPARSEIDLLNSSLANSSNGVRFAMRAIYGSLNSAVIYKGMDFINGRSRQPVLCVYTDQGGNRRVFTIFTGEKTLPATAQAVTDSSVTYALSQTNNDITVSGFGNWGYGWAIGLIAI